jgi:GNAT superfamily N-acetyltransferase
MTLSRRPALPEDADFMRAAHHGGYLETVLRQFGAWDEEKQDEYFETQWREGKFELLLSSGAPCGYVWIDSQPDNIRVQELVIHPQWQRRGLGGVFLKTVCAEAKERGVPVKLAVLRKNTALEFYLKHGFTLCGGTEQHVLMEWRG